MSRIKREKPEESPELFLAKPVKVIAVSAGKGGVGKSSIAINLAIALSQLNKNVLLFDADLGLANIDSMLGLQSQLNLSHVIQGLCSLSDIILPGPSGIRIIPSASGIDFMTQLSQVEHAGIINAFSELTDDFDYLIIDTASGVSDTVLSFTRSSQELILVVSDEPTSLIDAYALMKVMSQRCEWNHFHILLNMLRDPKDARPLFNKLVQIAEQFLDVQLSYLGFIPYDEQVHLAIKQQQAVLIAYPEAPFAESIREIAEQIRHWPIKPALGGNISFFLERLVLGRF